MNTICCEKNTPNTGVFPCAKPIKKSVGLFFQAKYANDGTRNKIDISINPAVPKVPISDMLANVDPSKRLFPITGMQDVDITGSEPTYRTFKNNTKELLQKAIYSFKGLIAGDGIPAVLVGYLENINCREYQFYLIADDGAMVGVVSGVDLLGIDWVGFYAMGGFAGFEKQSDITVSFDFHESFKYETLYQLTSDVLDIDILNAEGVRPVDITMVTGSTATAMVVKVSHKYQDGFVNTNNMMGLTAANFRIKRLDTGVVITPSTAIENPALQIYDLTYASIPLTTEVEVYMNLTPTFKYEGKTKGIIGL